MQKLKILVSDKIHLKKLDNKICKMMIIRW